MAPTRLLGRLKNFAAEDYAAAARTLIDNSGTLRSKSNIDISGIKAIFIDLYQLT